MIANRQKDPPTSFSRSNAKRYVLMLVILFAGSYLSAFAQKVHVGPPVKANTASSTQKTTTSRSGGAQAAGTTQPVSPSPISGQPISGGQTGSSSGNGVNGEAVYVYSFQEGSRGPTPISLLHDDGSGQVQIDQNGNGYVTPDQYGDVNIAGLYENYCPTPSSHIYLSQLGQTTGGVFNSAVSEISLMPVSCSQLDNMSSIALNETTTVAAVYGTVALGNFGFNPADDQLFGSYPANPTYDSHLDDLFNYANNFVSASTGNVLTTTANDNAPVQNTVVNTLANIMASCAESSEGSSGSDCQNLFAATTISGTAPTDTLLAMINIAQNPTNNVSGTFALSNTQVLYQPSLSSAPATWALSFVYPGPLPTVGNLAVSGSPSQPIIDVEIEDADGVPVTGSVSCSILESGGGSVSLGTATLSFDAAEFTASNPPANSTTVSCNYAANNGFGGAPLQGPIIQNFPTTTTVTLSSSSVSVSTPYTLAVSVASKNATTAVPTGTVACTASQNGSAVGSASGNLSNALANITMPGLPSIGSYQVSCMYTSTNTSPKFGNSTSTAVTVDAVATTTTTTVTAPTTVPLNDSVHLSVAVTANSGSLIPSGTIVCFISGVANSMTATLDASGHASLLVGPATALGQATINCNYNGSAQAQSSVGSTTTQIVTGSAPTNAGLNWVYGMTQPIILGGVPGRQGPAATFGYDNNIYIAYTSSQNPVSGDQDSDQYLYMYTPYGGPATQPVLINPLRGSVASDANPAILQIPKQNASDVDPKILLAINSQQRAGDSGFTDVFQYDVRTNTWDFALNDFPIDGNYITDDSPALATDGTYIYLGVRNAADHTLILCRETLAQTNATCQNFTSSKAMNFNPGMAVINGVLVIGYEEYDNTHALRVFTSTDQGQTIQENTDITTQNEDSTSTAPGLVVFNNTLYLGFRSNDSSQQFFYRATTDGFHWTAKLSNPEFAIGSSPAMIDVTPKENTPTLYNFFGSNDNNHSLILWTATP